MTNIDKHRHDVQGIHARHRYNRNIIKAIFKLSMPFVAYSLIATSVTIIVR